MASMPTSRTRARLHACEVVLERLAQDLQDLASELGRLIQEEHPVLGQRHLLRHGHVAASDEAHIRDGVMQGAKRLGGGQRRTVAGAAGETVNPRGF